MSNKVICELGPGSRVTWLYRMSGGYNPIIPVQAVIVGVTTHRVIIEVLRLDGTTQRRLVKRENLRERNPTRRVEIPCTTGWSSTEIPAPLEAWERAAIDAAKAIK